MAKRRRRERLIQLRKERGWVQQDVAEKLGVTVSCYGQYEQGARTPPLSIALKLEELFGVPLAVLFSDLEPNKTSKEEVSA
mgnify:FL=1